MQAIYTENDLLLFIYKEMNEDEAVEMQKAIGSDPVLFSMYHRMLSVTNQLDTVNLEPHPSSIDIILEHSLHLEHFH